MNTIKMTIKEARNFMVGYHKINTINQPSGIEGLLDVFNRLKSIQYDPLNTVGRNSDLVLQSRIKDYSRNLLKNALYKDRILIDAWDKQMCIYKTEDFPYFKEVRRLMGESTINTLKHRLSIEALDYIDEITEYIKENGPTFSQKINLGETKKHRWGHTKPSSATLDYLFHVGRLGINSKKNTSKEYDLIENLIDSKYLVDSPFKSEEEFIRWYMLRRISSMGLVSLKSGVMWSGHLISSKKTRSDYINILIEEGLVTKVIVEGMKEELFCLTNSLEEKPVVEDRVSFIAPLDNLIWDRKLVKKLFDFEYTWEVYTPIAKRKYGYYVLPMLQGSNFIGRIEFEMHRNTDKLIVKQMWFEEGVVRTKKMLKDIESAKNKFYNYLVSGG